MDSTILAPTEAIPIVIDADEVMRVKGTRVTLDTIVLAFQDGATPEEIVQQYQSLSLADVYLVIAYYLKRRPEVTAYLEKRQGQAKKIRKENETRFPPDGIRERLLARRSK